ncbi:MAG: hypothetical protein HSCHL_0981 [Hydrogenibacillus schlegelii]|uniref:Uncharacterized protein n=1 Tax=Hydrogenibacillus schlegelii TaxID=1484 RepID=A0A2T5G6U5_HYDSH|nr:hypothetical protein [Hydrogenibacillus schlegelii]PTQ51905.1 MAG: hypothetical protein HSCHL_0981 [Hydrogenibacillus schlegelii]
MSAREYHSVPYQTGLKPKFIGPLDFSQTVWLAAGGLLAYELARFIPKILPDPVFGRVHLLVPIGLAVIIAFGKHPTTNIPISSYLSRVVLHRLRPKRYFWVRGGMGDSG